MDTLWRLSDVTQVVKGGGSKPGLPDFKAHAYDSCDPWRPSAPGNRSCEVKWSAKVARDSSGVSLGFKSYLSSFRDLQQLTFLNPNFLSCNMG